MQKKESEIESKHLESLGTKSSILMAGAQGHSGSALNQSMSMQNPQNNSQLSGYQVVSNEPFEHIAFDEEALLAEYAAAPFDSK